MNRQIRNDIIMIICVWFLAILVACWLYGCTLEVHFHVEPAATVAEMPWDPGEENEDLDMHDYRWSLESADVFIGDR